MIEEKNLMVDGVGENVDLTDGGSGGENSLAVDISDALSERDWVKFTVHTRTGMPEFSKGEFSVIRLHEEFLWLHDTLAECPDYAGFIIPPPPPRPDFDVSREKLRKLGDAEGNLTKEEFTKMKQELEAEYLATFKKTVAMHEAFICRLSTHPVFKRDRNLHIFLEYEKELNVRGKNKKEKIFGLLSNFQKSSDELLLSNTMKDVDEFFEAQRKFLMDYHAALRDSTSKSDKMTNYHKALADNYIKLSLGFTDLSSIDNHGDLCSFLTKLADSFEKMRRIEARVASDEDLKLSDTLRYHMRDSSAAKDLLFRRLRCLANYEAANKNLDRARAKNKEVALAENEQSKCCQDFEAISEKAQEELKILKSRRIASFQKSLTEMAELELKHAKAHAQMLKHTIATLKADL